jgi:hypothetical protein
MKPEMDYTFIDDSPFIAWALIRTDNLTPGFYELCVNEDFEASPTILLLAPSDYQTLLTEENDEIFDQTELKIANISEFGQFITGVVEDHPAVSLLRGITQFPERWETPRFSVFHSTSFPGNDVTVQAECVRHGLEAFLSDLLYFGPLPFILPAFPYSRMWKFPYSPPQITASEQGDISMSAEVNMPFPAQNIPENFRANADISQLQHFYPEIFQAKIAAEAESGRIGLQLTISRSSQTRKRSIHRASLSPRRKTSR